MNKMKNELATTLDWDVNTTKLHGTNGQQFDRVAITRNDNDELLGIVSDHYQVLSNGKLQEICAEIGKRGAFRTEGFDEFKKGKLVLAFLRNEDNDLRIAGLPIKEFLVIGNSFDRSKQIYVGTSHSLIRCENQFTATEPLMKVSHLKNMPAEAIAECIHTGYEMGRKKLRKEMEMLAMKKVNLQLVEKLIRHLGMTDRSAEKEQEIFASEQRPSRETLLRDSIRKEMRELGENAFGLLNGVTWYTSHEMPNAGASFGNAVGTAAELNRKAFEFCLNIEG